MKINDGVALTRKWRGAVAEDETLLGFFDWVRKEHADKIIEDSPEPPLSLWMTNVEKRLTDTQNDVDTLAVRLDDLEHEAMSSFTITALIDRRVHDALIRAAGAVQP